MAERGTLLSVKARNERAVRMARRARAARSKPRWRRRLGCLLVTAAVLAVFGTLYTLSFIFLQPGFQETIREQTEIDQTVYWFLLKIALTSVTLALVASASLFLFKRWRKIRVFIIFHHEFEDHIRLMGDRLRREGISCEFIPYASQPSQDNLLTNIANRLRWADLVIAVPGTDPSFIDSEILTVLTLQKPLLIVVGQQVRRPLHTAYEGFPRFSLELLEEYDYPSFSGFIKHVCNHWSSAFSPIVLGLRRYFAVWGGSVGLLFLVKFLGVIGAFFTALVSIEMAHRLRRGELYAQIIVIAVATVAALVNFIFAVSSRIRARRIARQTTLTGTSTYSLLKDAVADTIIDKKLVECLLRPATQEAEADECSQSKTSN